MMMNLFVQWLVCNGQSFFTSNIFITLCGCDFFTGILSEEVTVGWTHSLEYDCGLVNLTVSLRSFFKPRYQLDTSINE